MTPLDGRVELRYTDAAGLGDALDGARGLLLWDYFSEAIKSVWDRSDSLEWIHVAAAGVDKLMFDDLRRSDVVVTNAHGVFDLPIAEFVLASVLARAKLVHESHDLQLARTWHRRETLPVAGATALVVGTGGIGRAIARLLRAVGMNVAGAGRTPAADDPDFGRVVDSSRLVDHVGEFDYVVNATPLTPETTGLFEAKVFAAMGPGSYFINIGRGASVVEADLADAVQRQEISGAALDVFEQEPLPVDSPLWTLPGVVVSAHMAGDVLGWKDSLARQFVDIAEHWLEGTPMPNVVDKQRGYVPGRSL
ncbi:2-hydroxyacid dehydrogenase [Luteipulveratus mongoliensis]|uniref:2-hydroxyacid dehydrogenase n=1 Tax=Luteipulveratus mongoliensis TaxID=571913 RepID=A0A0K1JQH8_9MICO|nr:2-hydroxyacid dehydrogenase [Luteipulveratus mongoliensis]